MKKTILLLSLDAALLLAPVTNAFAQSNWQTVADFQSVSFTAVDALTQDAAGNLYAAVSSTDTDNRIHAQIQKSSDHGATWTVVGDFLPATHPEARFQALGADRAGNLYAAGYTVDEKGLTRWVVRKSGVGGNSWSTVDEFTKPGGQTSVATSLTVDAGGSIYVAGHADESLPDRKPNQRKHWLVRRSRDGGRSWSTIDDFTYASSARAMAIVSTGSGLFVAGSGWNGKLESGERWLVRRGADIGGSGVRWQTVDEFQMQESGLRFDSWAQGLGVDGRGNLYAVGRSYAEVAGVSTAHWIVRRASSEGLDWTVVDAFQLDPGCFTTACGVAAEGQVGVYVVGLALARNHGFHWIVRRSATGEADSWSVIDDFRPVAPLPSPQKAASLISKATDDSRTPPSWGISRGLAILSDSERVYAGGSAFAAGGHAILRKLEITRADKLTAASNH